MEVAVKIFESAPKVRLGELIEDCDERNRLDKYGLNDLRGISVDKKFIETKANMIGVSLSSYKVVRPSWFAYVQDTSRRGDKIALSYNESLDTFIISSIYTTFRTKDENLLDSSFLFLMLKRTEFNRIARYHSWGSARETYSFDDLCRYEIPLPSIEVQRQYVAAYKSLQQLAEQNEAMIEPLQSAYNSYIAKLKKEYRKELLGSYIRIYQDKNKNGYDYPFMGLDITKKIVPTSASTEGLDKKKYLVVAKNMLAFSGMQTGRDIAIRIAVHTDENPVLISPAYTTFVSNDESKLLPEYLYLNFISSEMDRIGWFYSDSSVRSNLDWERFCEIEIPIPPIEVQRSIVALYRCAEEARSIAKEAREQLRKLAPAMVQRAANTPVEV